MNGNITTVAAQGFRERRSLTWTESARYVFEEESEIEHALLRAFHRRRDRGGIHAVAVVQSPSERVQLRVLLVDDEALIRWAVAETLVQAGHTVVEAVDGASAIHALHDSAPIDVVLLDLRLPDSDDLALLCSIRRQSPSSAVVMMTAHGTSETAAEARSLGAYDVMAKPFDVRTIESVLSKAYAAAHGAAA